MLFSGVQRDVSFMKLKQYRSKLPLLLLGGLILLFSFSCKEDHENEVAEAMLLLPDNPLDFLYENPINKELTTSCGTVVPETSGSTTTTGGDSASTPTRFIIEAYYTFYNRYTFKSEDVMSMKFLYDESRETYSLNPQSTLTGNCPTTDGLRCDSTSTSGLTCPTIDNIKCGGNRYFIFSRAETGLVFTAHIGTFDYTEGITLNDAKNEVDYINLELNFLNADGKVFRAKVNCTSEN